MKFKRMTVTVSMAKEWLTKNVRNRHLRKKMVMSLSRMMDNGTFDDANGDTICFDTDGMLIDGQHRLAAIVASGKPQKMLVITGVRPESYQTKDRGLRRSMADTYNSIGISHYTLAAASVRRVFNYCVEGSYASGNGLIRDYGFTDDNGLMFVEEKPGILDSVELLAKHVKHMRGMIASSSIVALHFLSREGKLPDPDGYWVGFCKGENLASKTGRHTFRQLCIRDATSKQRYGAGYLFYGGIIAAEKDRLKKKCQTIVFPKDRVPSFGRVKREVLVRSYGLEYISPTK